MHTYALTHLLVEIDLLNRDSYMHTFSVVSAHLVMRGFYTFSSRCRSRSYVLRPVKRVYAPCILARLPILHSVRVFLHVYACELVCLLYSYERMRVCLAGWLVAYFIVYSFQHSCLLFSFVCIQKKIKRQFQRLLTTSYISFRRARFVRSFIGLLHAHMNVCS